MRAIVISILDGQCGNEADVIVGRWYHYVCFFFSSTFTFLFGVSNLIIGDDWLCVKQKMLNQTRLVTGQIELFG
ncbi:MAG: hypothetical protein LBC02_01695 [Planctomycetaceae bacterium]|jgi:hypothetical protein|nr:hypothetical protein [Planctomycetaceae bacterium]